MTQPSLTCLILAGGFGSRLWPLSQPGQPKPCLKLPFLDDSLIAITLKRVALLAPDSIGIITHSDCVGSIQSGLASSNDDNLVDIIVEPSTRNTAPAIALALAEREWDNDALCLIVPSDQIFTPDNAVTETISQAQTYMHGHPDCPFMLFGLTPTHPSSRFGYMTVRNTDQGQAKPITAFIEKPEPEHALALMAQSGSVWNSGMILCRPRALQTLLADAGFHGQRASFDTMPAMSIDHALWHHHAHHGVMMPLHCQWHDVGTWSSLLALAAQNTAHSEDLKADALVINTEPDKPIQCVGVENLLVVNTPDGLLIMHRDAVGEALGHDSIRSLSEA